MVQVCDPGAMCALIHKKILFVLKTIAQHTYCVPNFFFYFLSKYGEVFVKTFDQADVYVKRPIKYPSKILILISGNLSFNTPLSHRWVQPTTSISR